MHSTLLILSSHPKPQALRNTVMGRCYHYLAGLMLDGAATLECNCRALLAKLLVCTVSIGEDNSCQCRHSSCCMRCCMTADRTLTVLSSDALAKVLVSLGLNTTCMT